jgi:hypothetical protein
MRTHDASQPDFESRRDKALGQFWDSAVVTLRDIK